MKKAFVLIVCLALCLSLSACTATENKGTEVTPQDTAAGDAADTERGCIVYGGGTENILVATNGTGLLSLSLGSAEITVNGRSSSYSKLKNGMRVEFDAGTVLETYPGMASPVRLTAEDGKDGCNDICGLYMQVIGELWKNDEGLNSNGDNVYLDLTEAPGLDGPLREAIVYLTGNLTGKSVSQATREELKEQGIYDNEALYVKDGCCVIIKGTEESNSRIKFTAEKYVSGLGAIFFNDCEAGRESSGEWKYTVGSFAIS